MKFIKNIFVILAIMLFLKAETAFSAETNGPVGNWLRKHEGYRLAVAADCECADILKSQKIENPYVATGDFDGDGKPDTAVVAVNKKDKSDFLILVFASKFDSGKSPIVYENFSPTVYGIPPSGPLIEMGLISEKRAGNRSALWFGILDDAADFIFVPIQLPDSRTRSPTIQNRAASATETGDPVENWLHKHGRYRLATPEDCECIDRLKSDGIEFRPSYQVVGDFDGDGKPDVAVIAINKKDKLDYLILVFSSKFDSGKTPIIYNNFPSEMLVGQTLFSKKYQNEYILIFGPLQADASIIRVPLQLPNSGK